jgi:glucan 1,3-beta-glucosidase
MPVTYADVWEFWLRFPDVASATNFVTIHILPYWEDFPTPAQDAAAHVATIRSQIAAAFPNREILIGEFGWPSAGRMREGALPSHANQARVVQDVLAQARRDNYRVNLIEAFDQPWKRRLEGTVGGHWGLYDAYDRQAKFSWGAAVSNHPYWRLQAGGGVALAAAVLAAAALGARGRAVVLAPGHWLAIAMMAFVSGTAVGWTVENVPIESLTVGDWLRSLAWATVAVLAPMACAAAGASGLAVPRFAAMLGPRAQRPHGALRLLLGTLMIALALLAMQAALGLDFDPRYRDFPFAPLTGAAFPFLALSVLRRFCPATGPSGQDETKARTYPTAEVTTAAILGLSAIYIGLNETVANWQALWFCAGLIALAISLLPAPDAPGS